MKPTAHPTHPANYHFSISENVSELLAIRVAHFFEGLRWSIAHQLQPDRAERLWTTLTLHPKISDEDYTLAKSFSKLLHSLRFFSETEQEPDAISVFRFNEKEIHEWQTWRRSKDGQNAVNRGDLEKSIDDLPMEILGENYIVATRDSWVPQLRYKYFLPAAPFENILERVFPEDNPVDYISQFLGIYYCDPKRVGSEEDNDGKPCSVPVPEPWCAFIEKTHAWISQRESNKGTRRAWNYIIHGTDLDSTSPPSLFPLCIWVRTCGSRDLYKAVLHRLARTGEISITSCTDDQLVSQAQASIEMLYLSMLFGPIILACDRVQELFFLLGFEMPSMGPKEDFSKSQERLLQSISADDSKENIDYEGAVKEVLANLWFLGIDDWVKPEVDGVLAWALFRVLEKVYWDVNFEAEHDFEEMHRLITDCIEERFGVFQKDRSDGRPDISIVDASYLLAYVNSFGPPDDKIYTDKTPLSWLLSACADPRRGLIIHEFNPGPSAGYGQDGRPQTSIDFGAMDWWHGGYQRWDWFRETITRLDNANLEKVSDALLAFYVLSEGVGCLGEFTDLGGLSGLISSRERKQRSFTEKSVSWVVGFLEDQGRVWEAFWLDQIKTAPDFRDESVNAFVSAFSEQARIPIDDYVAEKLGSDGVEILGKQSFKRLVDIHRKYDSVHTLFVSGLVEDWGDLALQFMGFMEAELRTRIYDFVVSEQYREFKQAFSKKGIPKPGSKPTGPAMFYFLLDVSEPEFPRRLADEVGQRVSLQGDQTFLKELLALWKRYRNPPAHGERLGVKMMNEVFEKLYVDEYLPRFVRFLKAER